MKEYEIPAEITFSETLTITEPTDPNHAEYINKAPITAFLNTLALKKKTDAAFPGGGALTVDKGGTGAAAPESARELLGAAAKAELDALKSDFAKSQQTATITFQTALWVGDKAPYTQDVTVEGMTADIQSEGYIYYPDAITAENAEAYKEAFGFIDKIESGDGKVTATCFVEKPAVDVQVMLKGLYAPAKAEAGLPIGEAAFDADKTDYGPYGNTEAMYDGGKMTLNWRAMFCAVTGKLKKILKSDYSAITDGYYFAFKLNEAFAGKDVTIRGTGGNDKASADTDWVCVVTPESKGNHILVRVEGQLIAEFDLSGVEFVPEEQEEEVE